MKRELFNNSLQMHPLNIYFYGWFVFTIFAIEIIKSNMLESSSLIQSNNIPNISVNLSSVMSEGVNGNSLYINLVSPVLFA